MKHRWLKKRLQRSLLQTPSLYVATCIFDLLHFVLIINKVYRAVILLFYFIQKEIIFEGKEKVTVKRREQARRGKIDTVKNTVFPSSVS